MISKNALFRNINLLLTMIGITITQSVFSQSIVSVDYFKGRAEISIPIYELKKGNIAVPISLNYSAGGIKVEDVGGIFGLGWTLKAGGSINRIIRGLPDDKLINGWLNSTSASLIDPLLFTNDNNSTTCNDEIADLNYISTNFSAKDTEPDIFDVSAPGLSCQIVFDKNKIAKIIPYRDYVVSYTTGANGIASITITNDKGTKYVFSVPETTFKKTSGAPITPVPYLSTQYNLFSTEIQYNSKWHLSRIVDAIGNSVWFKYIDGVQSVTTLPNEIIERNTTGFTKKLLYNTVLTSTPKLISFIEGSGFDDISFNYSTNLLRSIKFLTDRSVDLTYVSIVSESNTNRYYLATIGESGCDALPPYQFFYNGVNLSTGITSFPGSASLQKDYWGYYNASSDASLFPKIYVYPGNASFPNLERYRINPIPGYSGSNFVIAGADRQANASTVMISTLNKITYPTGGSTLLDYESNSFFDNNAQSSFNGGGIRVKKITDVDGISSANDIVKEFIYLNPLTLASSGKPISLPALAFTKAYTTSPGTQAYWEYSTIRSEKDLSLESKDIMYEFVTVKQTGLGKTVYEYLTGGSYWDLNSGDWQPSINYVGRVNCAATGDLKNNKNSYPFSPNPNYDFERGLLKKVSYYNENNALVNESEYTYQRSGTPLYIQGLKFDDLNGFVTYSKYKILSLVDNLTLTEKNTHYDLNDVSKRIISSTSYEYNSPYHKLATKLTTVNSDGVIGNIYRKYAKDYISSSSGDEATKAINALNIDKNDNQLIEVYNSVIKPGDSEKYISGRLTKFQGINNSYLGSVMVVPTQEFSFSNTTGVTTFLPSQIVSASTFQIDPSHSLKLNYESYDKSGMPATIIDNLKNSKAFHFISKVKLPYAVITNAKHSEVVYSSFEEDDENAFTFSGIAFNSGDAQTGKNSINLPLTGYLQKTLKKGNTKRYIFSCWIKPATTGYLTITTTSSTSIQKRLDFTSASTWTYAELIIPVDQMTTDFTVKVQSSTNVLIDDVLFYPDNSEVNTYTYDSKTYNKTSETTPSGSSVYYEYDRLGRLKYTTDQDKNILKKDTYINYNAATPVLSVPYFSSPNGNAYDGDLISFTKVNSTNDCLDGVTYTWNFGDGTSSMVTSTATSSHVFANPGTYSVSVTATHPVYGTKNYSVPVTIQTKPLQIQLCVSGAVLVDNCGIDPPYVASCGGSYPADSYNTYFNLVLLSGCSGSYSYQWEKSLNGGASWILVGTGPSYSEDVPSNTVSYLMRCKVNSSCGRSGISNTEECKRYNSTTYCPELN